MQNDFWRACTINLNADRVTRTVTPYKVYNYEAIAPVIIVTHNFSDYYGLTSNSKSSQEGWRQNYYRTASLLYGKLLC